MRTFSDQDLLAIWEIGLTQHPLDRALTLLMGLFPGQSRQALARLSIGQRDGYLLTLHEFVFGPRLEGQARCPACQHQVEFMLNTAEIRIAPPSEGMGGDGEHRLSIETDGCRLVFRLPTSLDLAAIVEQKNIDTARQLLAQRCMVSAVVDGAEIATTALPEAVISLLATQIALHDPQAEIELALVCPACGQTWLLFDIATFLWNKWDVQARRLLHEVHLLASAYGWSEIDILNLSAERRQFYLELVTV